MKSILMLVAGVLCVAGGLLHGSGFPVIHAGIAKAGVVGQMADIVDVAWVFMSVGFLTYGAVLIVCGLQMRKKNSSGKAAAGCVAASLTLFMAGATMRFGLNWHFSYFMVAGLLAAFACLPEKQASS